MPDDPAAWRPAFRPIETSTVSGEQPGVVVRDPLGLMPGPILIPEGMLPIVGRIDGRRSVADIERELRDDGIAVPDGLVLDVVRQLDESLLLHGELFRNTLATTVAAFGREPLRAAAHTGGAAYPEDPDACRAAFDDLLGPLPEITAPAPAALVAPHVDIARGAAVYRTAYRALAETEPADLYVVLGTGHQGPGAVLTGLTADWDTPRGRMVTDRDFVAAVHGALGPPDPFDVFLHRAEHSLEFQMAFLAHLLAARGATARVAGFLCGGIDAAPGAPDAEATGALAALEGAAASHGGRVVFVAGADLAHVGPQFGDPWLADAARRTALEARDRDRLGRLERADPTGFFDAIQGPGNPDRICSATSLTLVGALAAGPLRLLDYGQTPADDAMQTVSFAAGIVPARA